MRQILLLSTVLALLACGGSSIGRPCTQNSDCDSGQTCLSSLPGGYCTKGCAEEGTGRDCPGATVCAAHSGGLFCSALCQSQGDCRTEYECNGVATSSSKACRPKK